MDEMLLQQLILSLFVPPLSLWSRWTRVNKTYTIYDTRLKITGLLEGSEYQFRVTAVNKAGDSQPSDASPYILCKDPTCKHAYLDLLTFLRLSICSRNIKLRRET